MYEIRIFAYKGEEMPTIYHRNTLPEAIILLHQLQVTDMYKIELINMLNI